MPDEHTTLSSANGGYRETLRDVYQVNLATLFQLALLLTGDSQEAEANLTTVITEFEFSKQRGEDLLAVLQTAVARRSIRSRGASSSTGIEGARSMLQPSLLPVLQLERIPRFCFVLRILGYATSACAVILGIEEGAVKRLLEVAVLQLHHSIQVTEIETGPERSAPPLGGFG